MGPFVEDDECSDEVAIGPYALGQGAQRLSNARPLNEVANRSLGFRDGLLRHGDVAFYTRVSTVSQTLDALNRSGR
jgi:hypothetical protein